MARPGSLPGLGVHIGADVLTGARYARWPPVYACRDAIARMSRLCAAAGVPEQRRLLGRQATRDRIRHSLEAAVADLAPDGLLVLTFTGHSDRGETGPHGVHDIQWCLYDGTLPLAEITQILAALPSDAYIILVSDTCFAAAPAHFAVAATLVLLAACGADQQTLARPATGFVARIEELVLPAGVRNPGCTSYAWLHEQLRKDTPDVERPCVWTNRTAAWADRPFDRPAAPHHTEKASNR